MKNLKWGLAAILVGEFVTLWHKDKTFKEKITDAKGTDKVQVIFNELFAFNKKIVEDIQSSNVEQMRDKALTWFTEEARILEEKLEDWESTFTTRSDEKLPIYLMGLETHFKKYEDKAANRKEKLLDDYDLETSIEMFRKRITKARKALEEKSD